MWRSKASNRRVIEHCELTLDIAFWNALVSIVTCSARRKLLSYKSIGPIASRFWRP